MDTLIFDEFILSELALEVIYFGTFNGKGIGVLFRFSDFILIVSSINPPMYIFCFPCLNFFYSPILCQFWKTELENDFLFLFFWAIAWMNQLPKLKSKTDNQVLATNACQNPSICLGLPRTPMDSLPPLGLTGTLWVSLGPSRPLATFGSLLNPLGPHESLCDYTPWGHQYSSRCDAWK